MSKAANIYWDSQPRRTSAARTATNAGRKGTSALAARRTAPWWLSALIVVSIFGMLIVSINFRAFTSMRDEVDQNSRLSGQIQNLVDENLALQEEIHSLKTDPKVIEREARRIGINLRDEKVSVPTN